MVEITNALKFKIPITCIKDTKKKNKNVSVPGNIFYLGALWGCRILIKVKCK